MHATSRTAVQGCAQAVLGGLALVVATSLMVLRIEPVATWFYCFAWWSCLLLVDGVVFARTGRSLFHTTPRQGLLLAFHSVTFWLLFEAYNLRVRNWYYVGAPDDLAARAAGYVIAFATVLPGIAETTDLLASLFPHRGPAPEPRPAPPATGLAIACAGALLSLLPLLLPRYLFALLWLGPTLLLFGVDAPTPGSLFGRLASGDRRPLRLLAGAGLVMGGLWEALNLLARAKWIYTVPFFEGSKLFEMPIAGFLGYPPFAVEAYLFVRVIGRRAGAGALWELEGTTLAVKPVARRRLALVVAASLVLWAAIVPALDRETVWSTTPLLAKASWLGPGERTRLAAIGVITTEDLIRHAGRDPAIAEALGPETAPALAHAALATLKGIGLDGELLLDRAGLTSMAALAEAEPERLARDLAGDRSGARHARAAPRAQVKVWVMAARRARP